MLQAKYEAEVTSRAKDEFISTVSHELLTPLNGILGFSELIAEIIPPQELSNEKEIRSDLHNIHECGESLLRIINNVLELSKIEAGIMDSTMVEFCPAILMTTTLEMFKLNAETKPLSFTFTPQGLPRALFGDIRRLKQILFNLIGNAVKFTEKGSVELLAEWHDGLLIVTVKDTGIGISPEKQKNIFQPFYQADQTLTRKYAGVGLGLTIVYRMLKTLGGSITCQSEPGRGTAFTFTFPAQEVKPTSVTE